MIAPSPVLGTRGTRGQGPERVLRIGTQCVHANVGGIGAHRLFRDTIELAIAVIDALCVLDKVRHLRFDEEDMSVLITLAAQASIVLENARLYNSVRAERDRIIEAQERTRHELACNLHHGPVQLPAALSMRLDWLKRLVRVQPEAVPGELDALLERSPTSRNMPRHATFGSVCERKKANWLSASKMTARDLMPVSSPKWTLAVEVRAYSP